MISSNTMTDNCGVGFDIVGSRNFTIKGNEVSQRNAPFGGRYPYCSGYPAKLIDVSNFIVADNYCSASGPCAGGGVGLFVGPGVGAEAPNAFVDNTIVGSRVAAVRCGHDRYEGNRLCGNADAAGNCAREAEAENSAPSPQTNDGCRPR